jgi:hypothetical protein
MSTTPDERSRSGGLGARILRKYRCGVSTQHRPARIALRRHTYARTIATSRLHMVVLPTVRYRWTVHVHLPALWHERRHPATSGGGGSMTHHASRALRTPREPADAGRARRYQGPLARHATSASLFVPARSVFRSAFFTSAQAGAATAPSWFTSDASSRAPRARSRSGGVTLPLSMRPASSGTSGRLSFPQYVASVGEGRSHGPSLAWRLAHRTGQLTDAPVALPPGHRQRLIRRPALSSARSAGPTAALPLVRSASDIAVRVRRSTDGLPAPRVMRIRGASVPPSVPASSSGGAAVQAGARAPLYAHPVGRSFAAHRGEIATPPSSQQMSGASTRAAAPPAPLVVPQIDVERLSEDVYRHIQRKVRIERERRGY